ncbi:hypothetical protein OGAPHI_003891 [Ogataea philodendri]|uniref:Uncharacterized protein n=1 Tax=Ogataea philodendri TaxID=1378263 RepID=A0A9P8T494_9ASCO|nr:uncharacterized protein OGAPHI_003891 [Ogataea philodendri]KAH3665703.1 hypothetical protein OGAPHI_003891 [Ogataea philodendri]
MMSSSVCRFTNTASFMAESLGWIGTLNCVSYSPGFVTSRFNGSVVVSAPLSFNESLMLVTSCICLVPEYSLSLVVDFIRSSLTPCRRLQLSLVLKFGDGDTFAHIQPCLEIADGNIMEPTNQPLQKRVQIVKVQSKMLFHASPWLMVAGAQQSMVVLQHLLRMVVLLLTIGTTRIKTSGFESGLEICLFKKPIGRSSPLETSRLYFNTSFGITFSLRVRSPQALVDIWINGTSLEKLMRSLENRLNGVNSASENGSCATNGFSLLERACLCMRTTNFESIFIHLSWISLLSLVSSTSGTLRLARLRVMSRLDSFSKTDDNLSTR